MTDACKFRDEVDDSPVNQILSPSIY